MQYFQADVDVASILRGAGDWVRHTVATGPVAVDLINAVVFVCLVVALIQGWRKNAAIPPLERGVICIAIVGGMALGLVCLEDPHADVINALIGTVGLATLVLVARQITLAQRLEHVVSIQMQIMERQEKILQRQDAELARRPVLKLFFQNGLTEYHASRFTSARDRLGSLDFPSPAIKNNLPGMVEVLFTAFNTGDVAVGSAYVRLWLPGGWDIIPKDLTAKFFLQGREKIGGEDRLRVDFEMGAIYPGVEICGPTFHISAPRRDEGVLYYRIFTDKYPFPPQGLGELTLIMPNAPEQLRSP